MLTSTEIYMVGVGAGMFVLALILRWYLLRLEQRRGERLSEEKAVGAVPSEFRRGASASVVRKGRLSHLHSRFTVVRRTVYLFLCGLGLLLILSPLVAHPSQWMISLGLAAITVVLGIAARPFVENLICGLVLCFGRLARIGDTVLVDGEYGAIEDVTLTHCVIKRWDWLRYVVPNSSMMTKEFVNYSLYDNHRWVYVEFWIDYDADLELVESIAKDAPRGSKYFADGEEPRFWIVEAEREAIKCMVVAWATTPADGWMLSIDTRKKLLKAFQKHNIGTHSHHLRLKEDPAGNNTPQKRPV